MIFKDISNETQNLYRLGTNEKRVFFLLNRSGEITFELAGAGAEAHIFSFFIGRNADKGTLKLFQRHLAPRTTSHALIKSVLSDEAEDAYEGLIFIDKQAIQSDASQESRAILLSPLARAYLKPTLEILADDVRCRHAATASPLSPESLFFAQARGLSSNQASRMLVMGFFNDALGKIGALGINVKNMQNKLISELQQVSINQNVKIKDQNDNAK